MIANFEKALIDGFALADSKPSYASSGDLYVDSSH